MSVRPWHEEPIGKRHDRNSFDFGEPALNDFFRRFARQSHETGGAKTFVAIDDSYAQTVLGYYSLSPGSIAYARTPELVRRGLARYDVPAFRLARLAVDLKTQGMGLGGQLLLSAGRRCLRAAAEVGGVAMLIDAKNARVAEWYASYGALPVLDDPLCLVLPLWTIEAALKALRE